MTAAANSAGQLLDALGAAGRLLALEAVFTGDHARLCDLGRRATEAFEQVSKIERLVQRHLGGQQPGARRSVEERPGAQPVGGRHRGIRARTLSWGTMLAEVQRAVESPQAAPETLARLRAGCLLRAGALADALFTEGQIEPDGPLGLALSPLRAAPEADLASDGDLAADEAVAADSVSPNGDLAADGTTYEGAPPVSALALAVPVTTPHDRSLVRSYSLLDRTEPAFGHQPADAAAYYWCQSAREAAAARACALSIADQDGQPVALYLDLARQFWDEARHARFFLYAARRLASEAADGPQAVAAAPNPTTAAPHGAAATPRADARATDHAPLPIPKEDALLGMIWPRSLPERLALLNAIDEPPCLPMFAAQERSSVCEGRDWLRDGLARVRQEEEAHVKVGRRWLETLVPDRPARRALIGTMRALQPVLVTGGIAHQAGRTLTSILAGG